MLQVLCLQRTPILVPGLSFSHQRMRQTPSRMPAGGRRRAEAPLGCVDALGCLRQGQHEWTQTGAGLSLTVSERQGRRCPRPSPGLLLPSATAAVLAEGCGDQLGGLVTDPLRSGQRPRLREGARMPVYFANELEASTVP